MRKRFNRLSWTKLLQLEALLKAKTSIKEIVQTLGVHISTVYREMKRGRYVKAIRQYVLECFVFSKDSRPKHPPAKGLRISYDYSQ